MNERRIIYKNKPSPMFGLLLVSSPTRPLSPPQNSEILCYYVNPSDRLQVLRSGSDRRWHLKRIVFPGERLLFKAPCGASVQIDRGKNQTEVLGCDLLEVRE
jgi:hypothetical protein